MELKLMLVFLQEFHHSLPAHNSLFHSQQCLRRVKCPSNSRSQCTHITSCTKSRAVWPAGIYCFLSCWLINCIYLPSLPGDVFQRSIHWEMWAAAVITRCWQDRWEFQPHELCSSHRTKVFQLPSPHKIHSISWLWLGGMAHGCGNTGKGCPITHLQGVLALGIHPLSRKKTLLRLICWLTWIWEQQAKDFSSYLPYFAHFP